MAARFTYSKWDGTQKGFDLDAESILQELTDELLYHGDLNSALRQLMRDGMTDKDGNRIEGLRDLMERIRQRREEIEDSGDLGGVYSEIADALKDILDEERHTIDNDLRQAEASGDERRAENARNSAMERNFRLDMMPDDLAGMVREMQNYDFQSKDAQQRFDDLMEKLKNQLMQQMVDQMSDAMQNMKPEDMARMKDMMSALNDMIEKRDRGEDPGFEKFMEEFGDFFPENPETLDELLEQMAKRMQQMQAMMNSMTPEQRQQLQELSQQMLGDMDLDFEMQRLSQNLQSLYPQQGWQQSYDFNGQDQMGMQQAMDAMAELGELQQMEGMLRQATNPAQLAEVDLEKVRNSLGEEAANSLEKLAELTKMLEDAGLVNRKEGKLELTPRGLRAIGNNSLKELFSNLSKDKFGQHKMNKDGSGHERSYNSKAYEFGDPFRLDLNQTIRNALRRQGSGTPVRLTPEDFEIEQTEHNTRAATVLMIDLSMSMPMRGNFVPAKKVAMALHSLMSSQFPRDFLGLVGFSETAHVLTHEQLPEVSWDLAYGTNMQHGLKLARQMLGRQTGTKQIIMITDGEPTAHITQSGQVFFNYPPVRETLESTLREVVRCTKDNIRINTFVLDATQSLRHFIEQMTQINNGRAFFTDPDNLGSYVLVDFLENRRKMARSGR
ncbi:MAG: VWA domain-containing protein [Actinobacteria bacterium]|nr:VWA domain-containing protein [Actinomycetota bacterium]